MTSTLYDAVASPRRGFREDADWDFLESKGGYLPSAIDPRSLDTPHAVECPLVSHREDARWASTKEAKFRESSFRQFYDTAYATVSDTTQRFALALAASCRPFRVPALIPSEPIKNRHGKQRCHAEPLPERESGPTAESLGQQFSGEEDID
jgi:hypothetical protein